MKYNKLKIEEISFNNEDIITTSGDIPETETPILPPTTPEPTTPPPHVDIIID